ncbi:MAG TPA: HEAT repeat domain-containing protein [Polyangiales bacterium]
MRTGEKLSGTEPKFESSLTAFAYPEDLDALAAGMSDDEALRKIGRRTTTTGRFATLFMIIGVIVLVYFYKQRNDAFESRMNGLKEAGTLEGDAMMAKVRDVLAKTTYDDVKVRAIRNVGHFRDRQAVPLLINELAHAGVVRAQAASALAAIGSPEAEAAKPALLAALKTADTMDRSQVVWALAVLKEPAAADAILEEFVRGIWQKNEDFDPKVITEALGIQKLSSPELTGNAEKPVRALVAMALSEAPSPQIVPALVRMIQRAGEDPEVIRAAVGGLGRAGDPSAAAPLFQLMTQRPEMRQSVLDAIAKSTAAPQIATLLSQAKDATTKRDLVRLLRHTFDPRAADALATLVNDEDQDTRVEAAQSLAELGDARAVPALLALAKSDNDDDGNDALDALRQLGNPAAGEGLLALINDFPGRKAALMRAIGTSHYMPAGPMLVKELKGDDIGAASKAIAQLPYEPAYKVLVGMLKRDKKVDFSRPSVVSEMAYRNRLEAITGLAYFGKTDAKAIKELVTIVEDPDDDARLGGAAGAALGQMADASVYAMLLSKITDAKLDERVRMAYVSGLWRKPNAEISTKLVPLLSSTNTPGTIKLSAALAIGYAGNPANDEDLIKLLDDTNARRYAAVAVVLGGSEAGARKLLDVLPNDRDAEEILRGAINSTENDNFNLLLEPMFASGQIYRRMRVAEILKEGNETTKVSYTYPWTQLAARLAAGWDGASGMSARAVRAALYKVVTGPDAEKRRLVASVLVGMNMRGLLLAARDAGVKEARDAVMSMDRPKAATL